MTKTAIFDPGLTTGAVLHNTLPGPYFGGKLEFYHIDCTKLLTFCNWLRYHQPDKVWYESFHYRPAQKVAELYSIEVIAIARLYIETNNLPEPFTCMPVEAKRFWTDEKIKKLGLWQPGKKHAMDALRVYLTGRQKTEPDWFAAILPDLK